MNIKHIFTFQEFHWFIILDNFSQSTVADFCLFVVIFKYFLCQVFDEKLLLNKIQSSEIGEPSIQLFSQTANFL